MLVPGTRAIGWTALVALPLATLAGTAPEAFEICVLGLAVFAGGMLADALLARRGLAGVRVELPELVRLQKDRAGEIGARIHHPAGRTRPLRLGVAFPREIETAEIEQLVLLPEGAAVSRFSWECTARERGNFLIEEVRIEAASPLGFWAARTSAAVRAELRVYPNLLEERKRFAALFLRRSNLGLRAQRHAGQGREFEKLRDYLHGDSASDIHWKASAKRARPVTKVFQAERAQEVYVVVDASRLTGRAVFEGRSSVLERFVTAALILGAAAEQQGDRFGLITFSDRVLSFVRAKNGQAHYDACRDRIYALQPQAVSPDFEEVCAFIRNRLRKRALLIFLTALDDPLLAESFVKSVQLICRQHLIFVDMLKPPGAAPLFAEDDAASADELYARLGGHLRWHELRELEKVLQHRGVRLSLLDAEKLSAQLVAQHAEVKARQLV